MARVISIIQNKGGVGKSTVTSNLACTLSTTYPDKNILIVDLDGQGNQAISFGFNPPDISNTMYDVLVHSMHPEDALIEIRKNLHLLPANDDMNYLELDTLPQVKNVSDYFQLIKQSLQKLEGRYDYIFIDSPPELKIIFAMLMMVTNDIYIPFEPDAFNAQGLISLINKIKVYRKEYNVNPQIKGVIPIKIRENTILHRQVLEEVRAFCSTQGIRVMNTQIPHSVKYAEFIAKAKKPIVWADPESKQSTVYWNLLNEVIQDGTRNKENIAQPIPG